MITSRKKKRKKNDFEYMKKRRKFIRRFTVESLEGKRIRNVESE